MGNRQSISKPVISAYCRLVDLLPQVGLPLMDIHKSPNMSYWVSSFTILTRRSTGPPSPQFSPFFSGQCAIVKTASQCRERGDRFTIRNNFCLHQSKAVSTSWCGPRLNSAVAGLLELAFLFSTVLLCLYYVKASCPLKGKCREKCTIYKATLTSDNSTRHNLCS